MCIYFILPHYSSRRNVVNIQCASTVATTSVFKLFMSNLFANKCWIFLFMTKIKFSPNGNSALTTPAGVEFYCDGGRWPPVCLWYVMTVFLEFPGVSNIPGPCPGDHRVSFSNNSIVLNYSLLWDLDHSFLSFSLLYIGLTFMQISKIFFSERNDFSLVNIYLCLLRNTANHFCNINY